MPIIIPVCVVILGACWVTGKTVESVFNMHRKPSSVDLAIEEEKTKQKELEVKLEQLRKGL